MSVKGFLPIQPFDVEIFQGLSHLKLLEVPEEKSHGLILYDKCQPGESVRGKGLRWKTGGFVLG